MNYKPSGILTLILSILILSGVFIVALTVRVYISGTTFYDNMQKNSNTSQSNAPGNTNRSFPADKPMNGNFNSYSNGNSYSSGTYNSGNSYDTNSSGNSYTAPTPAPRMSNSDSDNRPMTSTNNYYNGRIIADDVYIDPLPSKENPNPDSESQHLRKGEQIKIVCRISNLIYRIKTSDGNTSEINGYSIEFTTENKQVPDCSSIRENGSF